MRVVCARYNQEMTGTAPKTMSNGRTPVFNLFHFSRTGDFVDHCGYHCVVPVWFVAFVPTTGQEERSSSEHGMAKRVRRTLQVLKRLIHSYLSTSFCSLDDAHPRGCCEWTTTTTTRKGRRRRKKTAGRRTGVVFHRR